MRKCSQARYHSSSDYKERNASDCTASIAHQWRGRVGLSSLSCTYYVKLGRAVAITPPSPRRPFPRHAHSRPACRTEHLCRRHKNAPSRSQGRGDLGGSDPKATALVTEGTVPCCPYRLHYFLSTYRAVSAMLLRCGSGVGRLGGQPHSWSTPASPSVAGQVRAWLSS